MKHRCDLCGRPIKECGRLSRVWIGTRIGTSSNVLYLCKECKDKILRKNIRRKKWE